MRTDKPRVEYEEFGGDLLYLAHLAPNNKRADVLSDDKLKSTLNVYDMAVKSFADKYAMPAETVKEFGQYIANVVLPKDYNLYLFTFDLKIQAIQARRILDSEAYGLDIDDKKMYRDQYDCNAESFAYVHGATVRMVKDWSWHIAEEIDLEPIYY